MLVFPDFTFSSVPASALFILSLPKGSAQVCVSVVAFTGLLLLNVPYISIAHFPGRTVFPGTITLPPSPVSDQAYFGGGFAVPARMWLMQHLFRWWN